ncbi:MAG: phenylalanine--tRNA ligase subunit alpha [Deltaproteobacteria bacterium]|nr:phenylalanine--tRNA ligase subunit alpha [Deltaproteobacteria bacterium]
MSRPDVDAILEAFQAELSSADSPAALEELARKHTGKKSPLKLALKGLKDVPADERPLVAQAVHAAQERIEVALDQTRRRVEQAALTAALDAEWADLSMPGVAPRRGARHPLTVVENQCLDVLRRLGFELVDGPEVEEPYYNFDALNIPEHHPARDMQDTFWVNGGRLLRSHTTTVQARVLSGHPKLPIRIASAGRVYRNEAVDATHLAMFHQLEGLWIDEGITFAHLKGILAFIVRSLYGADRKIRFKPKFYPYTEPSVGVDLSCAVCGGAGCSACHGAGWVTILGAGMIHPKVFMEFGYDPNKVSGIAFGLGTTRMAAQWAGVHRVKSLYEQDLRVMHTLSRGAR